MELETWQAPSGEEIPNHPSFPVLLYRGTGLEDPDAALASGVQMGSGPAAEGCAPRRCCGYEPLEGVRSGRLRRVAAVMDRRDRA
jgi:hypothetical protein